jgi:anti-anti-sigma factor
VSDPSELSIGASATGGVATLVVRGEIDLSTREAFEGALLAAVGEGATEIVIDAADVTFIDSSGVAAITNAIERGARVRVVQPTPIVRRVLELLDIDGLSVEALP